MITNYNYTLFKLIAFPMSKTTNSIINKAMKRFNTAVECKNRRWMFLFMTTIVPMFNFNFMALRAFVNLLQELAYNQLALCLYYQLIHMHQWATLQFIKTNAWAFINNNKSNELLVTSELWWVGRRFIFERASEQSLVGLAEHSVSVSQTSGQPWYRVPRDVSWYGCKPFPSGRRWLGDVPLDYVRP